MPKLAPSDTELMNRAYRASVKAWEEREGQKRPKTIQRLMFKETTFYERVKNPGSLSLEEFRRISREMKLSDAQILEMVRRPLPLR